MNSLNSLNPLNSYITIKNSQTFMLSYKKYMISHFMKLGKIHINSGTVSILGTDITVPAYISFDGIVFNMTRLEKGNYFPEGTKIYEFLREKALFFKNNVVSRDNMERCWAFACVEETYLVLKNTKFEFIESPEDIKLLWDLAENIQSMVNIGKENKATATVIYKDFVHNMKKMQNLYEKYMTTGNGFKELNAKYEGSPMFQEENVDKS